MSANDRTTTIQELKDLIVKFDEERDWQSHHTSKNLAISIALEAAELLEHYQWDNYRKDDKQAIADELADVLIYAFNFAYVNDIDIATAYTEKLKKAAIKYPAEIFNKDNDDTEDFFRIKKEYRTKKPRNRQDTYRNNNQ